jgi:hypothetical protein
LPGLASNHDPPDLCEPLAPGWILFLFTWGDGRSAQHPSLGWVEMKLTTQLFQGNPLLPIHHLPCILMEVRSLIHLPVFECLQIDLSWHCFVIKILRLTCWTRLGSASLLITFFVLSRAVEAENFNAMLPLQLEY